jgi:hypothetical protein
MFEFIFDCQKPSATEFFAVLSIKNLLLLLGAACLSLSMSRGTAGI